jgi:hypothetical protein
VPPPYTAQLRIYEPLAAFPPADQRRWRSYLDSGAVPGVEDALEVERSLSLPSVVGLRIPTGEQLDHAFVAQLDGVPVISPWSLRLRMADAAIAAVDGLAPVVAEALVPPALMADARETIETERASAGPDHREHVLSATWAVPVRWFCIFTPAERIVVLEPGKRALRYRADMSDARRRGARTLSVLRRTLGEVGVVEAVEGLARWLEEFHPRSLVELDYGGLVHLLDDDTLIHDFSAEDVAEVLTALGNSDTEAAAKAYERVSTRWRDIHLAERAN